MNEQMLQQRPEWKRVKPFWDRWHCLMENQISFSLKTSEKHTKQHSDRVLLYALFIAEQKKLSDDDKDALGAAAVFHDCARYDDWLDVGHGQRGADVYEKYCRETNAPFDERSYLIMKYHDRDDSTAKTELQNKKLKNILILYDIFKDADALDRMRLSANGLNPKYLRTDEAVEMIGFAKDLIYQMQNIILPSEPDRYLIVVDMQNDFIDGSLGTEEACRIVEPAVKKIMDYPGNIIFTLDTHLDNYLSTQEGKILPVKHCIRWSRGWELESGIAKAQFRRNGAMYFKPTFASVRLAQDLKEIHRKTPIREIELIGLCTDICVVSNALMIKGFLPEVPMLVDASCCAGVTPQKHNAALETMRSCQISVI